MFTHPVQVITEDITHPWDQMRGHVELKVTFVNPGIPDDDLRKHASAHIKAYHDKYAAEQVGRIVNHNFVYHSTIYSRSAE